MMKKDKIDKMMAKYWISPGEPSGGIFSLNARERLLGLARPYGGDRDRTLSNFWRRIKRYSRNALVDLELFIESADIEKVNDVITAETLKPVIEALLWAPVVKEEEPDQTRAEIAQLLVQYGFSYLKRKTPRHLSQTEERLISEAVNLSDHLSQYFKPEIERRFPIRPR